ncbi:hypothetical protein M413DRAFT_344388 [Hebeloma cylindrosporum]|uniref:Uncharacterized protein n=1 Tax=Hebeloma cylindrosporum TaxID=76867 RepID=A0A0C2YXD6_HEBCY|nr:hypothetical protein M413DRAFT_344388 [Hebeloma cylindrosporum h7]
MIEPLDVTPATSLCTCNKVFFNIWSACSYASGNNTLPVFSIWTSTCTNNSVDLTKSTSLSTLKGGLGIVIPPWAVPDVPGNTTFDLQKAVVLVRPQRWSTLQIVTPLITAILGIILTLISTAICRRSKLGKVKLREEFSHRLRRPRKVKSVQYLGAEWEIEPHEPEDHGQATTTKVDEPFVFVDAPPSSVGQDTIPAHPSRYSESSGDITAVARHGGSGSAMIPGNPEQRTAVDHPGVDGEYPFGPSHQIQSRTPLIPVRHLPGTSIKHPTSTDSELGMNRGWRFPGPSSFKAIHIPRPWKRGPGKLVEIQPTKGFRVDPRTSASVIGHSTEGSESTRDSPASSYPRRSFDIADNLDESDSLDHRDNVHNGDGDVGSDDEDTNLISHEEREERRRSDDVVTTRSPGARSSGMDTVNTSSTNPNITIISPTVSASSPRSTRIVGPSPSKTNVRPSFLLLI